MNQETAESAEPPAELTSPIPNFTVLLSPTRRGARLARLLAAEQLRTWGLPLDAAAHIVAELVANAATHGRVPGRNFRLTLYVVGGTLRIEVTDTRGDRLPGMRRPDAEEDSGRGLVLVDALADRWGVSTGRTPRKTVWAEITLPQEPSPERRDGSGSRIPSPPPARSAGGTAGGARFRCSG
ncbi:ATP-binding protein [Streptomyces barringtoniae]|uniref:ATP-binding protein n=1 Tax=Streptomyces barringtoniae TaxID=2892029 RepID=UPI001E518816|nr:ATP-binding protein [Streptomyces barringtoniae]MCC5476828.1 ATP-binding protein [Streptomyces barringtoniae]